MQKILLISKGTLPPNSLKSENYEKTNKQTNKKAGKQPKRQ